MFKLNERLVFAEAGEDIPEIGLLCYVKDNGTAFLLSSDDIPRVEENKWTLCVSTCGLRKGAGYLFSLGVPTIHKDMSIVDVRLKHPELLK